MSGRQLTALTASRRPQAASPRAFGQRARSNNKRRMATMKNLMLGTALMAGAGVLVLTTSALATPNSGFTTTNL